tara:strand:+ start:922 stop:1281 length:360 start_codon:yes stop_codon:yes gene_type:complete
MLAFDNLPYEIQYQTIVYSMIVRCTPLIASSQIMKLKLVSSKPLVFSLPLPGLLNLHLAKCPGKYSTSNNNSEHIAKLVDDAHSTLPLFHHFFTHNPHPSIWKMDTSRLALTLPPPSAY